MAVNVRQVAPKNLVSQSEELMTCTSKDLDIIASYLDMLLTLNKKNGKEQHGFRGRAETTTNVRVPDFAHWRSGNAANIYMRSTEPSAADGSNPTTEGHIPLIGYKITLKALQQFMGCMPELAAVSHNATEVERTIFHRLRSMTLLVKL